MFYEWGRERPFSIEQDTGELCLKDILDYEIIKNLNGTILEFHTNFSSQGVGARFFVEVYNDQNQNIQTTSITTNNFIEDISDGS